MKSIKQLWNSLKHALRGVRHVFLTENSFKIQVVIGAVIIVLAFTLPLLAWEQIVILMLIGFVLIMELINSVLERLVDSFRSRVHPVVRDIKDIMAAAVFLASLFAAVIGLIIFIPHLIHLV